MQFDLAIRNGALVSPQRTLLCDIGVSGSRIAAVGRLEGADAVEIYDASGKYVFPGFIDEHVHSRDPGRTHKEDFAHSTRAAAAGGVTTILEMPDSLPPVADAASFQSRAAELEPKAFVDFGLWAIVLGDLNIRCLSALAEAGVVGFKLFWGYALDATTLGLLYTPSPQDSVLPPPDDGQIYEAFCEIARLHRVVAIHAENAPVIARLTAREQESGDESYSAFLRSRPAFTEAMTIHSGITLAAAARAHLHVLHLAAGDAIELIGAARELGQAVTAETCPHYLCLSDEDFVRLGSRMKTYPPVRERSQQDRLWEAIRSGTIHAIGSDHAPHEDHEKEGGIWTALPGVPTVQSMASVMLDSVAKGKMTLNLLAAVLCENPARIAGIYGTKGLIAPGADADFTVVDMKQTVTIQKASMLSKSHSNPYEGITLQGAPVATFLRGKQVMRGGELIGAPRGRLVRPTRESQAVW